MGACPSSPICPTHNLCTFSTDTASFAFACGLSYTGANLGIEKTTSISDCISLCADTPGCTAISFTHDEICGLKSEYSVPVSFSDSISAYLFNATPVPPQTALGLLPCAQAQPLNTNLLVNGDFEQRDVEGWTQTTNGKARKGVTSTEHARTGDYAFIASGGIVLSQSITVLPRRSYILEMWSKQTKEGDCVYNVKWAGITVLTFTPELEYGRRSIMFPVGHEVMGGDVEIEIECGSDGEVHLDDVSVEVGWIG